MSRKRYENAMCKNGIEKIKSSRNFFPMIIHKLLFSFGALLLIFTKVVCQGQSGSYLGIQFQIISGEYFVTGFTGGFETIDIPDFNPDTGTNVNIKNIPDLAFTNSSELKYFTFPSSVESLGHNIFQGSTNLKAIYFRGSPPSITPNTFAGFSNLLIFYNPSRPGWTNFFGGYATFPNSTEFQVEFEQGGRSYKITRQLGTNKNIKIPIVIDGLPIKGIKAFAFRNNTNITSIEIPESVSIIEPLAFLNCVNLETVQFSEGQTNIGNFGFATNTSLKSLKLPNSLRSTGISVFQGCTGLTNLVIGTSLTNLAPGIFENCISLKNIQIPANLKTISASAFRNCSGVEQLILNEGLQEIGEDAFTGLTNLKNIVLPHSVTNLGLGAFGQCLSATNIVIGDGLLTIPVMAFPNCSSVKNIVIGNSVTSIGESAFSNCRSLTNIVLGSNVKSIGAYAFYMCTNLQSLKLPSTIEFIGENAFFGAGQITSVVFPASLANFGKGNFSSARLYFKGPAPSVASDFYHPTNIYYLPQASGWTTNTLNGSQTMVWELPKQSLTISQNLNQLTLQLNTTEGFSHTIQESEDLSSWNNFKTFEGNGVSVTETTNIDSGSKKFFRVLRQ